MKSQTYEIYMYVLVCIAIWHTSVASFLVLGGGGKTPNVPTEESNLYARASASETYIFRSPNTSARTINAVPFYYLWHGAV